MIIITGSEKPADKYLYKILDAAVNEYVSILYSDASHLIQPEKDADILFFRAAQFKEITCPHGAFIVRSSSCLPEKIQCKNYAVIVDSSDTASVSQIAKRKLKAITCGLSRTDTITLSSLAVDSAVLSLQRPLTAFDGIIVEPFELPVSFQTPVDAFSLMACFAALCLLGEKTPFIQKNLWNLAF
ncbi:hypothetical protein [Youxingia wuxianensis]|uniref:Uncharacterized protein n=1 Tax=Youxingia wuxianensis TaxID=2763678 RepID=A0A926EMD7_9FIRM|nr:hypothetical protein [Youxingia wuxianensis]MBC8586128.1 hypothetical protein [Youxingia wuxianensis]